MKARERCSECDVIADVFHAMSQPLTALEIGLELSVRQDNDVPQLRARVQSALEIAQTLHQRLVEFRGMMEAERGDARAVVALRER